MRHPVLLAVLVFAAACTSRPPVLVQTEHGRVRAYEQADADLVARELVIAPTVRRMIDSLRTDPPEVWVLEAERTHSGSIGICYQRRIELGRDALDHSRYAMIHELVHWYAADSPYAAVPHFVEEGLAHYVGRTIMGSPAPEATQVRLDPTHLWYDAQQWGALSSDQTAALKLVGHEVVVRLGLPRLRELAAAGVSPPEYLEAAGLRPEAHVRDASSGAAPLGVADG